MECFTRDGKITSGNIFGGYGTQFQQEGRVNSFMDTPYEAYHRFGLDWSESGYVFYCDGKEVSRASEHVSQVEQFILLTTECQGYRKGDGKTPDPILKSAVLPDCFTVDYVRVFDEIHA